jgi:hypothetical protein
MALLTIFTVCFVLQVLSKVEVEEERVNLLVSTVPICMGVIRVAEFYFLDAQKHLDPFKELKAIQCFFILEIMGRQAKSYTVLNRASASKVQQCKRWQGQQYVFCHLY